MNFVLNTFLAFLLANVFINPSQSNVSNTEASIFSNANKDNLSSVSVLEIIFDGIQSFTGIKCIQI